ncbi:MAG: hypothetical protein K0R54_589 [Clostridiaceae bacterium]|jgi:hypothetical protein|nr:hypothetical protein [Clostridiaceae bacterium]
MICKKILSIKKKYIKSFQNIINKRNLENLKRRECMKKITYVFFNIETTLDHLGVTRVTKLVAIKTNEDLRILSYFNKDITNQEKFVQYINAFEHWLETTYNTKFITMNISDIKVFINYLTNNNYKPLLRDFPKVMNYQNYNVRNEMDYKLRIKDTLTLNDYLNLYSLTYIGDIESIADRTFNFISLVSSYKFDNEVNRKILKENKK